MALLATAGRNAAVAGVTALLNSGFLKFRTSASVVAATLGFASTAFGAPATGVATAGAISSDTNAAGGIVDRATLETSAAAAIVTCSVGTSGAAINISSLTIGAGDTVSISALTLTQPAGTL